MEQLIGPRPSFEMLVSATPHLSAAEVAAFVDGSMPHGARAAAEHHLAECDDCRDEVTSCAHLVASAPTRSARRVPWSAIVPLAAALLLVMVWPRTSSRVEADSASERGSPSEGTRITLVAPAPNVEVGSGARRFVWHAIEGSIGYHVVVKDASGTEAWSGDVADTSVVLPVSVQLQPGERYVWRVDGQRLDGTAASSDEVGFQVAR